MDKKQKFYAVKRGRKTGIFTDLDMVLSSTLGYSGADFKSFRTWEEAYVYFEGKDVVLSDDIKPRLRKGRIVAFTDGSYNFETLESGIGVLICLPDNSTIELSEKTRSFTEFRNMAAETLAVIRAIEWCVIAGYEKVTVFYDCILVGQWAKDNYEARNTLAQFYKDFLREHRSAIDIELVNILGHSCNIYNNKADRLAKNALKG